MTASYTILFADKKRCPRGNRSLCCVNHLPDNGGPFLRKNTGIQEPVLVVANIRANRKIAKKVYDVDIESSSAIKDRMQDHGVGDNGMMRIRRIMSWAL